MDLPLQLEGDTKGPAKAGDGFGKKDVVVVQPGPSNQIAHHSSFTQGMSYMHSQNLFGGKAIKYSCRKLSEPGLN
ncbi:nuclear transcription factor Y subunit B-3-like [Magnolia sinica]|uniref:nuclear transcription factor Y subunit B-3-like n=1 Tax=Magnolia sinica TaxID=86752 RepID=UPI00265B5347|nr:nuclear transcription factor Y subunit B-3-like [Magnolia sinica]